MFLTELVNTPDGGLAAAYAAFLSAVFVALSHLISRWTNKGKEEIHKEIVKQFDPKNDDSLLVKVNRMEAQFKTNGGGSIFDMVKNTHTELVHLKNETYSIKEQVENVIASTRARTELALDQSSIAQFIMNDKGEIEYVNDAMSDLFGLSKSHFQKAKWLKVVDSQTSREEIVRRLDFAVARKIETEFKDIRCKNEREDITFYVKITIEPKTDSREKFLWYIGKIKEIPNPKPNG